MGKDEWDTKEGAGNECIVCTTVWQKAPLNMKWRRTEKKIKHVALAIVKIHLSEASVIQAVSHRKVCLGYQNSKTHF